jgi:hypothetical protein
MLTTLTTSTGELLATVQQFKDMTRDSTSTSTSTGDDAFIERSLLRASHAIQTYLGYPLLQHRYTETLAGFGSQRLMLSRTPVHSITSIFRSESQIGTTDYYIEDAEAGIIHRDYGFVWNAGVEQDLDSHPVPGGEWRDYTVTYAAGYARPGTGDTGPPLPYDIELATLETAKLLYQGRKGVNQEVQSESVGDLSVSYRSESDMGGRIAVPSYAAALLKPYKRWA